MKHISKLLTAFTLFISATALADLTSYSKEKFDMAQKEGKTVLVDFHASWCPTCKKQEPLINEVVNMKGYEGVIALKADFDNEMELKKSLNVSKQSTLVIFKGGKEVSRKTGITSKEDIKKLIDMGL